MCHMKAKKSLGQHFLKSRGVVRTMVREAGIVPGDTVLEAGPGKGVLTEVLLSAGAKVIAVEKDETLAEFLKEKFASEIAEGRLVLSAGDILGEHAKFGLPNSQYKIVANIPYYITGEFLRKFLSSENQPESMTLLVQKEVAERIVARDGKESILSMSVKAYGIPRYIQTVKAREFSPPPKIDSAILHISDISKEFFYGVVKNEEKFFALVRAGFAHKRKFFIRNLEMVADKDSIAEAFAVCGIHEKTRAEELALASWKCLYQRL